MEAVNAEASTPRVNFKIDSLPKLSNRGTDYVTWKRAWLIAFSYLQLNEVLENVIVSRQSPRRFEAHAMLMQAVEPDLISFIAGFDNPAAAWAGLRDRYDRDTGMNSVHLLKTITELRMTPDASYREHMDTFHATWQRMVSRCTSSERPVARALRAAFESDEVKGCFFLTTLPDSAENVVDNLLSKDVTSYSAIEPKLLDLADKHLDPEPTSNTAY